METIELTVTEEHLDKAILEGNLKLRSKVFTCLFAQAAKEHFGEVFDSMGKPSLLTKGVDLLSCQWRPSTNEAYSEVVDLITVFDSGQYDALRAMLPQTFTFQKQP